MDFEIVGKKGGQIPVFGDWGNADEMPITQYFESARQAGLFPRSHHASSSASLPTNHHHRHHHQYRDSSCIAPRGGGYGYGCNDRLYDTDYQNPSSVRAVAVPRHTKGGHHHIHGRGGVSKTSKCKSEDHSNGRMRMRRRGSCGCPLCLEEEHHHQQQQQQEEDKAYDVVVGVKQQHHHHHQQPIPMSSSHQKMMKCYQNNNNKSQFPKNPSSSSAINAAAGVSGPRPATIPTASVKPVDEDLYKIPPELLLHHSKKRKKMLGFFSKCLHPPCTA